MLRTINTGLAILTLVSAAALYRIAADTRRIAQRVDAAERHAERLQTDIMVLRAERAHLARPERIEQAARVLGLKPVRPDQIEPDPTRFADDPKPARRKAQSSGDDTP